MQSLYTTCSLMFNTRAHHPKEGGAGWVQPASADLEHEYTRCCSLGQRITVKLHQTCQVLLHRLDVEWWRHVITRTRYIRPILQEYGSTQNSWHYMQYIRCSYWVGNPTRTWQLQTADAELSGHCYNHISQQSQSGSDTVSSQLASAVTALQLNSMPNSTAE